ncbi:MAG: fatty acid desaturase family protein [Alphaproteobacteria bacterium]
MSSVQSRDYSLTGPENAHAVEAGLAGADWYRTPIPRKRMKELMKRDDGPATRDSLLWLGLLVLLGGLGAATWGTWWCVPFFAAYGVLYGSGGDSRWHECGHGTAFKTPWKNEVIYQIGSFMMLRNPVTWRWSHTRHHTDTIIVGRDPEIVAMRPPRLAKILLNFVGLVDFPLGIWTMLKHAAGQLSADEKDYVPETERWKVYRVARVWTAIFALTLIACFALGSILPAMLIGLPRMYGAWHHLWCGLTQHAGLAEDVLDHRLNCRTVYMNPFSRFIYWNMNYHVEHHMFPMVPYYRLPDLHADMKADCPPPYPGIWAAYKEIVPAILRQLGDPTHFVRRRLPSNIGPTVSAPLAVPAE